jgi:hypothetical protein
MKEPMSRLVSRLLAAVLLAATVVVPTLLVSAPAQAACRPVLKSLALAKGSVTGGSSTTGTVTLSCRAPKGLKVQLRSGAGLKTSASVWVAKGKKSATFAVTSSPTTSRVAGTVSASYGRKTLRRALTRLATPCYPAPVPQSVALPATLYAGGTGSGSVTLSCAARTALRVQLSSSTPRVTVPSAVIVAAGSRTASFAVSAAMPATSEDAFDATVRAVAGTVSASRGTRIVPTLRDVTIEQVPGADRATLAVTLTGHAVDDVVVSLSDDDAYGTMKVPDQVVVPADAESVSTSFAVTRRESEHPVVVTASLGSREVAAPTTVERYFKEGDSFVVNEPTMELVGPDLQVSGDLRVTLDHPAGPEGLSIRDVPIAPGGRVADVPVFFSSFVSDGSATISFEIRDGRGFQVAQVSELPVVMHPGVGSLSVPSPVIVGRSSSGKVTLIAAPAQDETVSLSGTGLSVPASVTIPAGATSASFPVSATAAGSGTITGTLRDSAKRSASLPIGAAIPDECRPTGIDVPDDVYAVSDYDGTLPYPATVRLGCTAPTDLLIPLRVNDAIHRLFIRAPAYARVPAGSNTGAFTLTVVGGGDCSFQGCTPALDTVLTAGPADLSIDRVVTVKPGLSGFTGEIDPATGRYALRIWMTGRASAGTVVSISTDNSDIITFPASTVIPTGSPSFLIPSVSQAIPAGGAVVGITVSIGPSVQHYLVGVHN